MNNQLVSALANVFGILLEEPLKLSRPLTILFLHSTTLYIADGGALTFCLRSISRMLRLSSTQLKVASSDQYVLRSRIPPLKTTVGG